MRYLATKSSIRDGAGTIMIADEQCVELESLGAEWVRSRLAFAGPGRDAPVFGFKKGIPTRGDVADWLMEKEAKAKVQNSIWLEIGKWVIAAVMVSIIVSIAIVWNFQSL